MKDTLNQLVNEIWERKDKEIKKIKIGLSSIVDSILLIFGQGFGDIPKHTLEKGIVMYIKALKKQGYNKDIIIAAFNEYSKENSLPYISEEAISQIYETE